MLLAGIVGIAAQCPRPTWVLLQGCRHPRHRRSPQCSLVAAAAAAGAGAVAAAAAAGAFVAASAASGCPASRHPSLETSNEQLNS